MCVCERERAYLCVDIHFLVLIRMPHVYQHSYHVYLCGSASTAAAFSGSISTALSRRRLNSSMHVSFGWCFPYSPPSLLSLRLFTYIFIFICGCFKLYSFLCRLRCLHWQIYRCQERHTGYRKQLENWPRVILLVCAREKCKYMLGSCVVHITKHNTKQWK